MGLINSTIATLLPLVPKPIVGHFSKPYIAGERLEDALEMISKLNGAGYKATVDVLGEHIESIGQSEKPFDVYNQVLEKITENHLDSNLSIKMTQMGMGIDDDECFHKMQTLVSRAKEVNNYVRIDMEDSPYTDKTFDIFYRLKEEFGNVGIVIQAYLKRSSDDVDRLIEAGANVRICKGIYIEPEEIAIEDRQGIRDNFMFLLEKLLRGGCFTGIATHDGYLIDESYRLIGELGLTKDQYEFQMLLGVTKNLRRRILDDGHTMRIYVPFGDEWYAYSIRRLKENPAIAGNIVKALFSRNGKG